MQHSYGHVSSSHQHVWPCVITGCWQLNVREQLQFIVLRKPVNQRNDNVGNGREWSLAYFYIAGPSSLVMHIGRGWNYCAAMTYFSQRGVHDIEEGVRKFTKNVTITEWPLGDKTISHDNVVKCCANACRENWFDFWFVLNILTVEVP